MTLGLCKKTEQEGDGFSLLHSESLVRETANIDMEPNEEVEECKP